MREAYFEMMITGAPPNVRFVTRSFRVIAGGDEPSEPREMNLWVVPDAPSVLLRSLVAIFGDREFTAPDVVREAGDGKTRPLIDELGLLARDAERLDRYLVALIDDPCEGYVLRRSAGGRYGVAVRPKT